jgi:dihydrofolate reductase
MTMLALIAAVANNGVIGRDNQLPWHLPLDLQYFKAMTLNHAILMGRKTFDSIGKPLPKRRNMVITRDLTWQHEGCEVFHSIAEALADCSQDEKVFVIGGEEIFNLAFPLATHLYLTEIKQNFSGNVFFPVYDKVGWKEISRIPQQDGGVSFDFVVYKRLI